MVKKEITVFFERKVQSSLGKPVYLVDNLNDKNIIELIQEITPLIYYLISRLKNKEENLLRELIIELEFPPCESPLTFSGRFKINDENPLISIKNFIKDFEDDGYFLTLRFNLLFLLKSQNSEEREENEEESEEEREEESEEESEEEKIINTSKSFKSDECVICLTEPPNVLFCNCGHIAISVECSKIEC